MSEIYLIYLACRSSWDVYLFKWTRGAVDTKIIQVPGGSVSIEKYWGSRPIDFEISLGMKVHLQIA